MIPEGWQQVKIGEIGKVVTGSTPPTKQPEFYDGDIPFVAPGDLGFSKYVTDAEKTLTEAGRKVSRLIPAGATLFTCIGSTIGKIGIAGVPLTTNQQINAVIPDNGHNNEFIYYQLARVASRIARLAGTQAVPIISKKQFAAEKILVAPSSEQKQIQGVLETWDRAIETVEALIAGARAQKQALMQQLLPQGATPPKKRLPGFSGEWKQRTVTQLGRVESGGTPASGNPTYWGGDIAWVTPGEITKQQTRHLATTERTITKDGLAESSTKLLPAGSVIVCTRATVGELAIATGPITTNQGFKNIVPSDRHDSDFIYYLLLHNKKALNRVAAGSTFAEVSKADFERLTFIVPALEEQRAIAGILIDSDETIQLRSTQLAALRREKAALMQQLLTGKRRVKLPESEVA